jgi:hypothetical protein
VLSEALDMDAARREASADQLRRIIESRHPADWLQAQLDRAR